MSTAGDTPEGQTPGRRSATRAAGIWSARELAHRASEDRAIDVSRVRQADREGRTPVRQRRPQRDLVPPRVRPPGQAARVQAVRRGGRRADGQGPARRQAREASLAARSRARGSPAREPRRSRGPRGVRGLAPGPGQSVGRADRVFPRPQDQGRQAHLEGARRHADGWLRRATVRMEARLHRRDHARQGQAEARGPDPRGHVRPSDDAPRSRAPVTDAADRGPRPHGLEAGTEELADVVLLVRSRSVRARHPVARAPANVLDRRRRARRSQARAVAVGREAPEAAPPRDHGQAGAGRRDRRAPRFRSW